MPGEGELNRFFERVAEAFNQRDLDGLGELTHPTRFEFTSHFVGVEGRPYRDWRSYFADVDASWDGFRIHPVEVHPNDHHTAAAVTWHCVGVGKESGAPVDQLVFHVWHLPDGRLGRGRSCGSLTEAREAADAA